MKKVKNEHFDILNSVSNHQNQWFRNRVSDNKLSQETDSASSMLGLTEDVSATSLLPENEVLDSLLDQNNNHFRRRRYSPGRSRNRDCARISGYWPRREKSRTREYHNDNTDNADNTSCAPYVNRRFLETKFRGEESVRPNENNSGMDCYVNPPVLRCPPADTNNQDVTLTQCQIDILLTLAASYCSNTAMVDSCKFALLSCDYNTIINNYLIAAKFQLCDVMDRLLDQIRANFLCVSRTKEFLSLPLDVVMMFLQDNFINSDNELDIFFAALNWVDFNKMQRLPDAGKLLNCVRYVYINPADILLYVEPNLHLFTGPDGMEAMLNIYRYRALILSGTIPPPPNVMAYCVPNATFSQEPVYQTPSEAIGISVPPMRNNSPQRYMMNPPQGMTPPSPPPPNLPFMCVPDDYRYMTMPPSAAVSPIYTPYNDAFYSSRLTAPGSPSPLPPATPQTLSREPSAAPSKQEVEADPRTEKGKVAEEARSKESVAKKKDKVKLKKVPKSPRTGKGSPTVKDILIQLKTEKKSKEKPKPKPPEKDKDLEESAPDGKEEPTSPKKAKDKKKPVTKLTVVKKSKSRKTPDAPDSDKEDQADEDKKEDDGSKAGSVKGYKKAKSPSNKKRKKAPKKSDSNAKKGDETQGEKSDDEDEKDMKRSDDKLKNATIIEEVEPDDEDEKKNSQKEKVVTVTKESQKKKDADANDQVDKGDEKKKTKGRKQTKKDGDSKSAATSISPTRDLKKNRDTQSAATSISPTRDLKKDRDTQSAATSISPTRDLKKDRSTKSSHTSRRSSDLKKDRSSKSPGTSRKSSGSKKDPSSKSAATSRKSSADLSVKSKRRSSRDKTPASGQSPSPTDDKDESKKSKRKSSKHSSPHGKKDEGKSGHKSKSKEGEEKASPSPQPDSDGPSDKHHKRHRKKKSKTKSSSASPSPSPSRPSRRGTVFLNHSKVHKPSKR